MKEKDYSKLEILPDPSSPEWKKLTSTEMEQIMLEKFRRAGIKLSLYQPEEGTAAIQITRRTK